MTPFFSTPDRIAALRAAATEWLGTPFMPNAAVKGVGVSCQKLVGAVYQQAGCIAADFEIPEGPMDWSHAHTDSLVTAFLTLQPNFAEVTPLQPSPGDLLGFRIGGCINHCGVLLTSAGHFLHCLRDSQGVRLSNVNDATYRQRLEKVWRPLELNPAPTAQSPTPSTGGAL